MNKTVLVVLVCGYIICGQMLYAQLNPDYLIAIPETDRSEVFDVLPDRMGNIWIATQSGLMRYDGYDLRHFYPDPNDPSTIGDILTYRLLEDSRGRIWIGCMNFVSMYNPQTKKFVNYSYAPLTDFPMYSQAFVFSISEDSNGRVYFGVNTMFNVIATHALLYFDENENTIKPFEPTGSNFINNVFETNTDPKGNLWVACNNGIFKIDTLQNLTKINLPTGLHLSDELLLTTLKPDHQGNIWMANDRFLLFKYNTINQTIESWSMEGIFGSKVERALLMEMTIGPQGKVWLATSEGPVVFNPAIEKFEVFNSEAYSGESTGQIYGMSFDAFGDLWLATATNGLMRYSERTILNSFVSRSNDTSSITSGWAYKIFETADDSIWVPTGGGSNYAGINLLNINENKVLPTFFRETMPQLDFYAAIAEISPNKILIDTSEGYFIFDTYNKTCQPFEFDNGLDTTHLFNIYTDSRENTWYCSVHGLYRKQQDTEKLHNYNLSSLPGSISISNELTNVYEGIKNRLWLLTNHGLFLYNYNTDSIERIGADPSKGDVLTSQDINSFYQDSSGIAWVGTWQGGLSRLDPETRQIKTYTIADGLPSMSIQGILADEKNNTLWLSTFEGLSQFNIVDEQFQNFSVRDGIQGLLFADGAALKTSNGVFVFGGNNGVTWFKPEDIIENSKPPLVFITSFKVGNAYLNLQENQSKEVKSRLMNNHTLTYHQNNIAIEYTGVHYTNPSKNSFSFKLENYDDAWREVGNLRIAHYYGLPPGNYTFRVKAANSNGIWNEQGATISFRIKPPWWQTWWAYTFYGLVILMAFITFDRIQRRRLLEKERRVAREKELAQAKEIEKAYQELKTTQKQLIHSEKMASLGELTAGIAHEIQNPLNFVNNFSEVNRELIAELKEEIENGNLEEVKAIIGDLEQNEEKISHHGKRADGIVKGMLQHSRIGSGQKEPTDLNALADEYLRLSYHGLRAKDKNFNADFKTDFDESLPNISVVPQDIGRVLLNLFNNAFYAVHERTLTGFQTLSELDKRGAYKPLVTITTKSIGDRIEIHVKDNGPGIPDDIKGKIFQPFFTTKPTGSGTGLGLSMSYDIITKGHGGNISVHSEDGKGTEFVIQLPVEQQKSST